MIEIATEDVMRITRERCAINGHNFEDIIWTFNGSPIKITTQKQKHWLFTGLSNVDFITSNYLGDRPWRVEPGQEKEG